MEEPPSLYTHIALYAAGNALSLAVFLILYQASAVLYDFRDPMVYALLCSVALRGPKDWLVEVIQARLRHEQSLVTSLIWAATPLGLFSWVYGEAVEAAAAFRTKFQEIREEYRRAMIRNRSHGQTPMPATEIAPSSLVTPDIARTTTNFEMLSLYAKAGIRTLTARKEHRRRRRRRKIVALSTSASREGSPSAASNRVILWLWLLCTFWGCFEWIKESWSHAGQVIIIIAMALSGVVFVVHAIASMVNAYWHPQWLASGTVSPVKPLDSQTPLFALARSPRGQRRPRKAQMDRIQEADMVTTDRGPSETQTTEGFLWGAMSRISHAWMAIERPVRGVICGNIHTLVTLALIAGLLIGLVGGAAFLGIRIAREARGTLIAARELFPTAWPGISAATPLLSDALADGGSPTARSLQQVASEVRLPPWLEVYRRDTLDLAQRSLPGVARWLEGRLYGVLQAHNLTDALSDARFLYEVAQGPRACTENERQKRLVAMAKAEVSVRKARSREDAAAKVAREAQQNLTQAVDALAAALLPNENTIILEPGACSLESGANACLRAEKDPDMSSDRLAALQEQVAGAERVREVAKAAHKSANVALDEAERASRVAGGRVRLCMSRRHAPPAVGNATGVLQELQEDLKVACETIFSQWQIVQGLQGVFTGMMRAGRRLLSGRPSGIADVTRLQRLAQAAAGPLIAVLRALIASVGPTTGAALFMGGLGIFRLGLGMVHVGVQAALFFTLLYYLLAAKTDPLMQAVAVLPLPEGARTQAATALNAALGGVFLSLIKLVAFHGLFSWISFRVIGAPLAYTTAVASSLFALLPFVPTYAVALPGCAVVALQGRIFSALLLIVAHFGAYYLGDSVMLEGSGGHPFIMSLAILGGLYAFPNPIIGCLLGPVMLSLLSALGAVHMHLMRRGIDTARLPLTSPTRRSPAKAEDTEHGQEARDARASSFSLPRDSPRSQDHSDHGSVSFGPTELEGHVRS